MLIVSGWALQPAPSADPLWGERTPALGGQPSFSGTLQSARLYGVEMPSARLPNERTVREEMHAGRISLDVVVQPADTLSATGPIVRVADGCGRELLALAQSRTKLVFNMRMHATAIGLTTPSFAMMQALPSPPPDGPAERVSVESIAVSLRRGLLRFTASGAATRSQEIALSPTQGWSLLIPWNHSLSARTRLVTGLWVCALLLPTGFWAPGAWRPSGWPAPWRLSSGLGRA